LPDGSRESSSHPSIEQSFFRDKQNMSWFTNSTLANQSIAGIAKVSKPCFTALFSEYERSQPLHTTQPLKPYPNFTGTLQKF
jgi:hypothetical protein